MNKLISYLYLPLFLIIALSSCREAIVEDVPTIIELKDDKFLISKGESLVLNMLGNDNIVGENITITVSEPKEGVLTTTFDEISYLYTPAKDFVGAEHLTYTVCDDDNNCKLADITILVDDKDRNQNEDLPDNCTFGVIAFDNEIISGDDTIIIYINSLLDNDYSCGSELDFGSFKIIEEPTYGKFFYRGNYALIYIHKNDFIVDNFKYEISNIGGNRDVALVNIIHSNKYSKVLK